MHKFTYLTLSLLLPTQLLAQSSTASQLSTSSQVVPILWEIKSTKPSYLFGTIHLSDPRVSKLHPKAQAAFDKSDEIFAEIDLTKAQSEQMMLAAMRQDGTSLKDDIGEAGIEKLNKALKTLSPNLNSEMFLSMKTWMVAFTLELLESELKHPGSPALDMQLLQRAIAAGKKTGGLESFDEQLGLFDDQTKALQVEMFHSVADMMLRLHSQGKSLTDEFVAWYLSGGAESLDDFEYRLSGKNPSKEMEAFVDDKLIVARNQTMAKRIDKLIKAQPKTGFFFAVGAAHLIEQGSIVEALQKQGYTVTRIK